MSHDSQCGRHLVLDGVARGIIFEIFFYGGSAKQVSYVRRCELSMLAAYRAIWPGVGAGGFSMGLCVDKVPTGYWSLDIFTAGKTSAQDSWKGRGTIIRIRMSEHGSSSENHPSAFWIQDRWQPVREAQANPGGRGPGGTYHRRVLCQYSNEHVMFVYSFHT